MTLTGNDFKFFIHSESRTIWWLFFYVKDFISCKFCIISNISTWIFSFFYFDTYLWYANLVILIADPKPPDKVSLHKWYYLFNLDSICSIGYCGTSYGADISFDVWRRFGFSSRLLPETKSFATSCVTLLTGIPSWHPVTDLRAPTSNPDGLSLPIRAQEKNYYHIEHIFFML